MSPRRVPPTLFCGSLFFTSLCAVAPVHAQQKPDPAEELIRSVRVTRWADPNTRPETMEEWLRAMGKRGHLKDVPFSAQLLHRSPAVIYQSGRRIDLLLGSYLYPGLKTEIMGYIRDIEVEGWAASLWSCSGGTPAELRTFLQGRHGRDGISGCLLVGDLPVAWYRNEKDFNGWPAEFPCDLFFMDLDGIFKDTNFDNKYDQHYGNSPGDVAPDIFVGRLTASPLAFWEQELVLLKKYFKKAHDYRTGAMQAPERALAFQDDDWYHMATYQDRAYGSVIKVTDKLQTSASNYKQELVKGYESVVICVHSSPSMHSFRSPPGGNPGALFHWQLWEMSPGCLFYNLFACSAARYTAGRYFGGVYIFGPGKGLVAVGTSKTGSMLVFQDYYDPLGAQQCFGDAFRYWFARRAPFSAGEVMWFYGMTLLGDPTLRISRASLAPSVAHIPQTGGRVDFVVDGRPDNGGRLYLVAGSLSGSEPGMLLPGLRLPINPDAVTDVLLMYAGSSVFAGGIGRLDNQGKATASLGLYLPIPKDLLGRSLTFAAVMEPLSSGVFPLSTPAVQVRLGAPQ